MWQGQEFSSKNKTGSLLYLHYMPLEPASMQIVRLFKYEKYLHSHIKIVSSSEII